MFLFLTILTILTSLLYALLMLRYYQGWKQTEDFTLPAAYVPHTFISIIVPARNEEHNIAGCIRSVLAQDYPAHLFELIVVDDCSTDRTAEIIRSFTDSRVKYIPLAAYLEEGPVNAYKKKALSTGISQSRGTLILTTDADCTAGPGWLRHIAAIYEQKQARMIVAPVDFTTRPRIVEIFQSIDFLSMQGITAAALQQNMGSMSNGANLAFSRAAFEEVKGYTGIDHLASGDDYLLMMKIKKAFPGRIVYLKSPEAIVHTLPQPGWLDFLQQRIRWASKSGKYDDTKLTAILVFVYLFNILFVLLLVLSLYKAIFFLLFLCLSFVKIVSELFFVRPVARFFGKGKQLTYFILLQPLHVLYIISAGLLGMIGVYSWKGRKVK